MAAKKTSPEEIFHKAIEISDHTERVAYLGKACKGDEKLRAEVEILLKSHEEAGDFLEIPTIDPDITLDESPLTEGPETVIGRYKLLEKIGEGGMASVYMAEQKQPIRRRVALKIIKLGMDTRQVIARFEAERQALAMMDHPNIAKVLDAGTTDTGRPYFVMELVRGVAITEFCDKNNLNTRERLGLFVSVCQAVQHAHQKGITHRDIKPSNVMVTLHDGEPIPKVIDFGIAKAVNQQLTEKTVFTRYAQMIGTPEYMSPEQAEMSGLDVDIRTDVFSLGVLLYELLTGTTPFDQKYLLSKGYAEMQRIIREEEPTKPSTKISTLGEALIDIAKHRRTSPDLLQKLIRTDLDWIVMKTLEKDRSRRYDSVSEFVADVKRHLNNEPVLAGRPGTVYRITKFVRRRRALVASTASVAAVIVVGFIVSIVMYLQAEQARKKEALAREKEELARSESQTVADFLRNDLLGLVVPEKAKSPEVTVRYVLEAASENLENKFEGKPLVEASIRQTLGETYRKLGDYEAARPHLERAYEIRRAQLGDDDPATLTSMSQLGWLYFLQTRYDQAEPLLIKAMETRQRLLGEEHADTLESMTRVATLYFYEGRCITEFSEVERLFVRAYEIAHRVLGDENVVTLEAMRGFVEFYSVVGDFTGEMDQAESTCEKGLEISRRVLGEEHEITLDFAIYLARVYRAQGRYDEALTMAIKVLETSRRVLGEAHPTSLKAMYIVGQLYQTKDRYDEAEPLLEGAVMLSRSTLGTDHVWTQFYLGYLADLRRDQGRYNEAEVLLEEIIKIAQRSLGDWHPSIILNKNMIIDLYAMQGRYDEAKMMMFKELERLRSGLGNNHPATGAYLNDIAWRLATHFIAQMRDGRQAVQYAMKACEVMKWKDPYSIDTLAAAYAEAGDFESAVEWQKKALALAPEPLRAAYEPHLKLYESGKPYRESPFRKNAEELLRAGHYRQAEQILLRARATSARLLGEQHEETLTCINELIKLYEAWGKPEQAEKWRASLSNKEQANE